VSARWVRAVVEGPGGSAEGRREDEVLVDTEAGLALAAKDGPTLILSLGGYRLYLTGEETLSNVAEAVSAAFDEHSRREAELG